MSDFPRHASRFIVALMGVTVLASGSAFLWATLPSTAPSSQVGSVAHAASASKSPIPTEPSVIASARPATRAERTAAKQTIVAQLHAFDTSNWKEAVKYQSDSLKGNFATPEAFGQMIQTAYPAFVRPQKVVYGLASNVGGTIQFEVNLVGQDGSSTPAVYLLVKEGGDYRVASVMGGNRQQPRNNNMDLV